MDVHYNVTLIGGSYVTRKSAFSFALLPPQNRPWEEPVQRQDVVSAAHAHHVMIAECALLKCLSAGCMKQAALVLSAPAFWETVAPPHRLHVEDTALAYCSRGGQCELTARDASAGYSKLRGLDILGVEETRWLRRLLDPTFAGFTVLVRLGQGAGERLHYGTVLREHPGGTQAAAILDVDVDGVAHTLPSSAVTRASCCGCGRGGEGASPLAVCSGCLRCEYCDRACQARHWKSGHKEQCRQ